jgi:hypothetical protein
MATLKWLFAELVLPKLLTHNRSSRVPTASQLSRMFDTVHRYDTVGQGDGFFSVMSHVNGRDP